MASTVIAQDVPKSEVIDGLDVYHPRTLHLPKIGRAIATPLYASSLLPVIRRYRSRVDVVLGAWAHPDGCAAVALAKLLKVPAVVKVHGSDINTGATLSGPRRAMQLLLPKAFAMIAVSQDLANKVAGLGVEPSRIHVVMNGVDAKLFQVRDRLAARKSLGLPEKGRIALCVGNLEETKGVFDLRRAFESITDQAQDLDLYFVGGGTKEEALAKDCPTRMHVMGSQPFETMATWMAACDLLVLPSWNEGTPNVLLEALACGRRVLATRVGGVPDVVSSPELGEMVEAKDVAGLAKALLSQYSQTYVPAEIAERGARGDWRDSASHLMSVLSGAISDHSAR